MAIPRFLFSSVFASKSLSSFYLFCFFNFHFSQKTEEGSSRSENRHSKNIQNASEVKKIPRYIFALVLSYFFKNHKFIIIIYGKESICEFSVYDILCVL